VSSLKLALNEIGVKTRPLPKHTEFAINCFKCNDTGMHMYVNESVVREGVRGWCYCHRRGCVATIQQLAAYYHLLHSYESYKGTVATTEAILNKLANLSFDKPVESIETSYKGEPFDITQFPSPLDSDDFFAKKARRYLNNRQFSDSLIALYDIRYANSGDYAGRAIIPFYEHKELVYFQARSYLIHSDLKILNPPDGAFRYGKSEYLFNFDRASMFKRVVIAEGWASAMTCGLNGVAINGNKASESQLDKLIENWQEFIVVLDNGVEDKTFKLAKEILYRNPRALVGAVLLSHGDPNDHSFKDMQEIIKRAKTYNTMSSIITDAIRLQ